MASENRQSISLLILPHLDILSQQVGKRELAACNYRDKSVNQTTQQSMALPLRVFDRYVLRTFIRYLLFSAMAAALIFIVVDLIEHLDTFIDKKVPYWIVVEYYALFLPYIFYLVLPVATLLASLFTIGGLSRSHELTAMKASGIGLYRPFLHLLAAGILLSGINFFFGETLVPYTNKLNKDLYRYRVKGMTADQVERQGKFYLRNRPGEMVHLDHFDSQLSTIYELDWERFSGVNLKERINARMAIWKDSAWWVENGQRWVFYNDSTALQPLKNQRFTDLGFQPADLAKVQTTPEEMGYWQLRRYVLRTRDLGGDPQRWEVDLAFKTSMPFTCAIVVLLGAYRRSGLVLSVGIGLLISFIFFALQQVGRIAGYNAQMQPYSAAWLGNAVFILVGILLYARVRK
jgi:lipopolysaccharide export system permease protein